MKITLTVDSTNLQTLGVNYTDNSKGRIWIDISNAIINNHHSGK